MPPATSENLDGPSTRKESPFEEFLHLFRKTLAFGFRRRYILARFRDLGIDPTSFRAKKRGWLSMGVLYHFYSPILDVSRPLLWSGRLGTFALLPDRAIPSYFKSVGRRAEEAICANGYLSP